MNTYADAETEGEEYFWLNLYPTYADAMEQVIHGKRRVIELVLAAQVAGGHVLLEDVPGTGKTALARTLAQVIQGSSSRVQFTPCLLYTSRCV